jgi:hypothetical protein
MTHSSFFFSPSRLSRSPHPAMAALAPCLAARPVTHSHPARRIVAAAAASNEAAAPAFTRRNAVAATLAAGLLAAVAPLR